ncbi:hypothetical protein GOV06_01360 [Candidatus Woesearchaeota archaeon]|nr:hypothetical protein [Candidatus Woesearchaeota archaeon]
MLRKTIILLIILSVGIFFSSCDDNLIELDTKETEIVNNIKGDFNNVNFDVGTFITPMNFPLGLFDEKLIEDYFDKTKKIGPIVGIQSNWFEADNKDLQELGKNLAKKSKEKGFIFIYQSNIHSTDAKTIKTPNSVKGNSFTEEDVKNAYTQEMLRVAEEIKPDILFIAVELNNLLFNNNEKEFNAFKEYSKNLYQILKEKHPDITISISFGWDHMKLRNEEHVLMDFKDNLDVYSLSTYPAIFGLTSVDDIPENHYSDILEYLPENARISIGESGWSSIGKGSSEEEQKKYYERLPELYKKINPEYVIISYVHDLPDNNIPKGTENYFDLFSRQGLYDVEGNPKPALKVVQKYN